MATTRALRAAVLGLSVASALRHAVKESPISVFGHKAPDTDTVSSAIIYAWELNSRNISATAFVQGELNTETTFVLNSLGIDVPPLLPALEAGAKVACVDTNNPTELPDDLGVASIHSIVDHHKLSGLMNAEPLEVDMRPLVSATSILYSRSKSAGLTPPPTIAGLMLAGILSDSLVFRSPATTPVDKVHAEELGRLSGLDVTTFGDQMLEAKSNIDHFTPSELVMSDTRVFKIGGRNLRVSTLPTTRASVPLAKRVGLVQAMQTIRDEEGLDDVLFFIIDIIKEEATFVPSSPSAKDLVERAWSTKVDGNGLVVLPGVLSRKKQIVPRLEAALQ